MEFVSFVSAVDLEDRPFSGEPIFLFLFWEVLGKCLLSFLLYFLIVIAVGI